MRKCDMDVEPVNLKYKRVSRKVLGTYNIPLFRNK